METNQEKVNELIGVENYKKLIANGFFPIEITLLKTLLSQHETLLHLEKSVEQLEATSGLSIPPSAKHLLPDIDIDVELSISTKPIPKDYDWKKDIAFQTLEDEAVSLNVAGAKLHIHPLSTRGTSKVKKGELGVSFMGKGNKKLIEDLKKHQWEIHRWRIEDPESATGKATMIQATKYISLRYQTGYEPKPGDIK